jgi:dihydropteroate synthase
MEYYEAVNTLEGLRRVRPKLGTETTASLLSFLEVPVEEVTAVQIAGSNGKGSTARILEGILTEAGLDVGLYTSPDLNDVRERVRVCGRKIPKHQVVEFVEAAWPFVVERGAEGDAPTCFEAVTALALWHFGREAVDVAVLEVGIGGRYDATSVVDPVAAAVTTVTMEHTDVLGDTVAEIGRDLAAVAPADAPLVTATAGDALAAIREEVDDVLTVGADGTGDPCGRERHRRSTGLYRPDRRRERPRLPAGRGDVESPRSPRRSDGGTDRGDPVPRYVRRPELVEGGARALRRDGGPVRRTGVSKARVDSVQSCGRPGRSSVVDR